MGTKEVMATAPLVALIYDRTFISGSFASALKARAGFIIGAGGRRGSFRRRWWCRDHEALRSEISRRWITARTQLGVIAHYLALAFWPQNLVLDYYDWPIVHSWSGLGRGCWSRCRFCFLWSSLWRKPWLGFLGAWFFIILAPSSSVLPIFTEIAAEHRMYLPLIAPVVLARRWRMGDLVAESRRGRGSREFC